MSEMTIEYGNKVWKNEIGQLHCVDGPAFICPDGRQEWWVGGKLHRLNKPAIIWSDGKQLWYIDGKIHCMDGPAYIDANGTQAWYINDINITDKVKSWIKENNFPDYTLWADTQKIIFRLAFSGIPS